MWKKSENYLDERFLTLYYDGVTMKHELDEEYYKKSLERIRT